MIGLYSCSRQVFIYLDPILIYISLWIDCLFEIRKIAVCFLWLSSPGDYRVTDEALLAETTYYDQPSLLWIFSLLLKDLISDFYLIILFQADNIFDTNASLTYGPQLVTVTIFMVRGHISCLQYVQSRWGLCTASMLRAGHPTLLAGRGKYDLSKLKTSRLVHEG